MAHYLPTACLQLRLLAAYSVRAAAARPASRRHRGRDAGAATAGPGKRQRPGAVPGRAWALEFRMALVVTAPSPLEAQTGLVTTTVSRPRLTALLRRVTLVGATWYALSLIAESIARFAQPWGSLDGAVEVTAITAMLAVVAVCTLIWLARRADAVLLFLATLAV